MTRKTSKCYKAVFEFIEEKLLFKLEPKEFMTDYEDGMRLAIKKQWPNAIIHGCWFHLCKAILKRARKLGMVKLLQRSSKAKIILRGLMSVALLPAEKIMEGFLSVKRFANKSRLFEKFRKLFVYFERYWLNSQVCF